MTRFTHKRAAFSLLELLTIVVILGAIASILVPRVAVSSSIAKFNVRDHHKATINAEVEHYHVDANRWPANNLCDIGASTNYYPSGLPTNPIDV